VGRIPQTIQDISVVSAAVAATSKELEASKRLIAFLASERATPAITKSGMQRVKRQ
jgi:molybdate transport system substrate-binding protein